MNGEQDQGACYEADLQNTIHKHEEKIKHLEKLLDEKVAEMARHSKILHIRQLELMEDILNLKKQFTKVQRVSSG